MITSDEVRDILSKQGVLEYLEDMTFAVTPEDFCEECNTHKHLCGHETAIIIAATDNFMEAYMKDKDEERIPDDIDPKTGKITREHYERCVGCALCEGEGVRGHSKP